MRTHFGLPPSCSNPTENTRDRQRLFSFFLSFVGVCLVFTTRPLNFRFEMTLSIGHHTQTETCVACCCVTTQKKWYTERSSLYHVKIKTKKLKTKPLIFFSLLCVYIRQLPSTSSFFTQKKTPMSTIFRMSVLYYLRASRLFIFLSFQCFKCTHTEKFLAMVYY